MDVLYDRSRLTYLLFSSTWKITWSCSIVQFMVIWVYIYCRTWSDSLWTRMAITVYPVSWWLSIAVLDSYYVDLPCCWSSTTNYISFSIWNDRWKTFVVRTFLISPYSCRWSWYVISLWTLVTKTLYLAAQRLWMVAMYSYHADLLHGLSCKTNLLFFPPWSALLCTLITTVSMSFSCSFCWRGYGVSLWTWAMEVLHLVTHMFSIAVIRTYYLELPSGWSGKTNPMCSSI